MILWNHADFVSMLCYNFTRPFQGGTSFVDHLCYVCPVFVMLSRLFIAALWSPARKGLNSWLLFVMCYCVFVTFPCGILGQVWYLIVSINDLCRLTYFTHILRYDIVRVLFDVCWDSAQPIFIKCEYATIGYVLF